MITFVKDLLYAKIINYDFISFSLNTAFSGVEDENESID